MLSWGHSGMWPHPYPVGIVTAGHSNIAGDEGVGLALPWCRLRSFEALIVAK